MQPLTPQTTRIIPPDDVASATSPILYKHLNEFGEEFSNATKVVEKPDGNPVSDVKEFSDIIKTYDFETFIQKLLHQDLNSKETNFEIISTRNRVVILLLMQQLRCNQHRRKRAFEQETQDLDTKTRKVGFSRLVMT
ncbi:hypothetical protein Tco_0373933 [Tanacetum coccineum]